MFCFHLFVGLISGSMQCQGTSCRKRAGWAVGMRASWELGSGSQDDSRVPVQPLSWPRQELRGSVALRCGCLPWGKVIVFFSLYWEG